MDITDKLEERLLRQKKTADEGWIEAETERRVNCAQNFRVRSRTTLAKRHACETLETRRTQSWSEQADLRTSPASAAERYV